MRRNKIAPLFLSLILSTVAVHAEETAVVTEGKINVRGKPSFAGEVITQLERGNKVTVLERINIEKPKPNEPTNWARIKLPENTPVWVFAPFVKENKVAVTRLNLRAGPSENYSVVGRMNRGDEVKGIRTVEEWTEIEAPKDAYAFIDLGLIRFDGDTNAPAPTTVVAAAPQPERVDTQPAPAVPAPNPNTATVITTTTPPEPAPAITVTEEKPAATSPPTNVTTTPVPAAETSRPPEPIAPPQITPELPQVAQPIPTRREGPLPKRVVRREGVIRATKSIQAPTWYELANAETGKTINYLYDQKFTANSGFKLKDYRAQKVVVTGEEAIDPRWPNTPILDIETLDVVP